MRIWLAVAAAFLLTGAATARPADCLLIVEGKTYIDGVCEFEPQRGGFKILSYSRPLIFGDVATNGDGTADAYWNEEPGANHAHTPLGELRRDGACWANDTARFCAWKIGETRSYPPRRTEAPASDQPDFAGRDRAWAQYRTRILEGIRGRPNFAGRFNIITVGCGTGCRIYPVVDRSNGRVWDFPLGGEEYPMIDLKFTVMSSEVTATWDRGDSCFQQKVNWTETGFRAEPARQVSCNSRN